ncbi:MAG: putative Holliday junction resolvase [Halioglobus sp.]
MVVRATITVLAFDFGLRQIGVAVGNSYSQTSQPLAIVKAKDGKPDWQALEKLRKEWLPDLLVVGDPLNMDGSASGMSERAHKFARRLHGRWGITYEMADERLTSFEAKQSQSERGHQGNYKDEPIDSYAAELILQSWFRN